MVNKRPSPAKVAADRWEIARRYAVKGKVGKRTRSMAAIRLAELTRWLDDAYGAGVEIEPSKRSEGVLRVFANHMAELTNSAQRIRAWIDRYTPWLSLRSREIIISEATACPIKYTADKLGWKLRLTDAKRTELKITTIGAIDCTKEQRAERRKQRRAELMRELRAKRAAERNP